jgi:hypothetical protein
LDIVEARLDLCGRIELVNCKCAYHTANQAGNNKVKAEPGYVVSLNLPKEFGKNEAVASHIIRKGRLVRPALDGVLSPLPYRLGIADNCG